MYNYEYHERALNYPMPFGIQHLICKIFGHKKRILWCTEQGWDCVRCGVKHVTNTVQFMGE